MTDYLTNLANRVLAPAAIRPDIPVLFPQEGSALSLPENPGSPGLTLVDTADPASPDAITPDLMATPPGRVTTVENAGSTHLSGEQPILPESEQTGSHPHEPSVRTSSAAHLQPEIPARRSDQKPTRPPFKLETEGADLMAQPTLAAQVKQPLIRPVMDEDRSHAAPPRLVTTPPPQFTEETDPAPQPTAAPQNDPPPLQPTAADGRSHAAPPKRQIVPGPQPAEEAGPTAQPISVVLVEPASIRPVTADGRSPFVPPPPLVAAQPQPAEEPGLAPQPTTAPQIGPPSLRPLREETSRLRSRQVAGALMPGHDPVINISIGRVEVRAVAQAAQAPDRPRPAQKAGLSLQEYLKKSA